MNGKLRILGAVLMCLMASLNSWAEEFIVDLNRPNTYAAVFESGLRPRHTIEQETSTVEVRPAAAVGFQLLHWNIPPVKAVWAFNVGKNKQLYNIRGVVPDAWTKEEALRIVTPLELALGGDASTIAKMKEWIEGYPESSINGDTWGRKAFSEDKKISVAYYFRHSMQPARPLSLSVSIGFRFPPGERGFHEGILEPPPGFEHIDISKVWSDSGGSVEPLREGLVPKKTLSPIGILPDPPVNHPSRWWWSLVVVVLAVLAWAMVRRGDASSQ
jgi:hypothetical protein